MDKPTKTSKDHKFKVLHYSDKLYEIRILRCVVLGRTQRVRVRMDTENFTELLISQELQRFYHGASSLQAHSACLASFSDRYSGNVLFHSRDDYMSLSLYPSYSENHEKPWFPAKGAVIYLFFWVGMVL